MVEIKMTVANLIKKAFKWAFKINYSTYHRKQHKPDCKKQLIMNFNHIQPV